MRNSIFKFLYHLGVGELLRLFQKKDRVPILVFHRISNEYDPYTEPLSPANFDFFISFLKKKYRIKPLKDLFASEPVALRSSCFITFDDAMNDFFCNAVPIIGKHHVPVTLFVPTGAVLKGNQLWNHRYFASFLFSRNKRINIKIAGKDYVFDLHRGAEYHQVMDLHHKVLQSDIKSRDEILNFLEGKLWPKASYSKFASVMQPENLTKLPGEISFGSHTVTHHFLPALSDEYLKKELQDSKNELEGILNVPCNIIAYPNGGIKVEQLKIVKRFYNYGFVVGDRLADLSKVHDSFYKLQLPRINVNDKTVFELYLRINGFHRLVNSLKDFFKRPLKALLEKYPLT